MKMTRNFSGGGLTTWLYNKKKKLEVLTSLDKIAKILPSRVCLLPYGIIKKREIINHQVESTSSKNHKTILPPP